jgi:hypothetical protein
MLPGFRFLFGAIVVSMSILMFGLGAAALLRTAHEEFASAPVWRPTPETRFAQAVDASQPVIAMLRVDDASKDMTTDAIKDGGAEPPPPADAAAKQGELSPTSPDLDKTASLQSDETPPSEATKPQAEVLPNPVPENPPQAEATAAPAIPNQPKVATTEQPSSEVQDQSAPQTTTEVTKGPATAGETAPAVAAEAAPLAPKTFSAPRPAGNALTRIATRDGRPVFIAAPKSESPKAVNAKVDKKKEEAIRRRRAAQRAARRRRIAMALRAAQQQAAQRQQQQQLNPFAQQQPAQQQQPAR